MALTWNAEQQILQTSARELVRTHAPLSHYRKLRDSREPTGFSAQVWSRMRELGWSGIAIPEAYGGLGLGLTELAIVLEECGRLLVPQPLFASQLLGGALILRGGSEEMKQRFLPQVAEGNAVIAAALEEARRFSPYTVATRAERGPKGFTLNGSKSFVLEGNVADAMVVSARSSGGDAERDGISLFLIEAGQAGVRVDRAGTVDNRNAARVVLENVVVPESALIGALGQAADVIDPVLDRATIGAAAELLGLLSEAYDVTLEYLKTRVQFDVRIGSFQALQHRAANMFCELELCRSIVRGALEAADANNPELSIFASAAKARLTDASRLIAREAIQLHGGIGMTDEHDIGFYLKRAAVLEITLGDSSYHRDRFARLKGF
jgi:acyl-CoA dehydrogenase